MPGLAQSATTGGALLAPDYTVGSAEVYVLGVTSTGDNPAAVVDNISNGEVAQVSQDANVVTLTNNGDVTVAADASGTGNATARVGNIAPDNAATGAYQSAITQKHILGDVEGATWDASATVIGGIAKVASVETKGRTATAVMNNSGTVEVSAAASGTGVVDASIGTGGETGAPAVKQFVFSAKGPDATTTGSGTILNSGTVNVSASAAPLLAGTTSATAKVTSGIVQQVQATGRGNSNLSGTVNNSGTLNFSAAAGVGPGTALTATAFATEVLTQRAQANGGGLQSDAATGWNDIATLTMNNSGTINLTTNARGVESATSLIGVKLVPAQFGQYANQYPNTYGPNEVGAGTQNAYQLFGADSPILSEHGVLSQRAQANGWGDDTTSVTFTNAAAGKINILATATATNPAGNALAHNTAAGLIGQKTQANGTGNDTSTALLTNLGRIGVDVGSVASATDGDSRAVSTVTNAIQQVAEVTGPTKFALVTGGGTGGGGTGQPTTAAVEGSEPEFGYYTNIGELSFVNGATGVVDIRSSAAGSAVNGASEAHSYVDAGAQQSAQVDGGTPLASFDNRNQFNVTTTSLATGVDGAFATAGTAGLLLDVGFPVDEGRLPTAHDVVGVSQVLLGKATNARFANTGLIGVTASATANGGSGGAGALASAAGYRVTGEPVGVTVTNGGTLNVSATALTTADAGVVRLANAIATGMGFYANYAALPEMPDIVHGGGSDSGNGQNGHPAGDEEEEPEIPTYALTGTVENTGTIAVTARSTGDAQLPTTELELPSSIVAGQTLSVGSTAVGVEFISASNTITMTNRGTISASAITDGAPAQAIGVRVLDYENASNVQAGEGYVFTFNNNGGTIIARQSTNGGTTWTHGTAIDTSLAPNAVNIRFDGTSNVYGNIKLSADDAILVASGITRLDGVINPYVPVVDTEVLPASPGGSAIAPLSVGTQAVALAAGPVGPLVGSLTVANGATLMLLHPAGGPPAAANVNTFTLASGGTLALQLPNSPIAATAQAAYPYINANTANLAGRLMVQLATPNGLYANAYNFQDIIDANTRTGTFSSVVTNTGSVLLTPAAIYDSANNVDLTVTRVAFGAVPGLTFNQKATGDGIEAVYSPTQTGPYGTLLANLFLQTAATYPAALDMLSGDQYAGFVQNLRNSSLQVSTLVSDQMDCAISKDGVDKCREPDGGLRLWALGGFNDARVDTDVNAPGYDADNHFALLGLDYTVGNFTVGAFGGYRKAKAEFTRNNGLIEADGYQIGAVAGFDMGSFYIRGNGSYADLNGDSRRSISVLTTAGTAVAKPEYSLTSLYGEAGGRLELGKTWLTPFVGVEYTKVKTKAFTETGVPGANLNLPEQSQSQTSFLAGLKWAGNLGSVIPEAKVAYRHDDGNGFFTSTARFAEAPGNSLFTVRSPVTKRDTVMAGFNLAGVLGEKVTGRIGYQGRFGKNLKDNAFYGSLTVRFGGAEAPPPPPPPPPVVEAPPPPPVCNKGLSERRAETVRGYLNTRGIDNSAITTQGFGETNPRVPTADGVREVQNRRVEITYGPGSGM